MKINFFEHDCKENSRADSCFGICDDQNGKKAYTDVGNKDNWIAHVTNNQRLEVIFTPIDNCIGILKENTQDQESTCDEMLVFSKNLYLVELKKQRTGGWLPDAKKQLESTINCLKKCHDLRTFTGKKAYACNKKHPYFTVIGNAEQRAFFKKTGFRLDAQTKINLS